MDMKQYEIKPDPFWQIQQMQGADGYDTMEAANARGWHEIADWGSEGWNLGEWPYLIIFFKKTPDGYQLAEYCEGDITVYKCPTKEIREAITDEIAFDNWKRQGESWVKGIESAEQAPDNLRGPYSRARAS